MKEAILYSTVMVFFFLEFVIAQDIACDFQNAEVEHQRNCKTLT